MRAVYLAVASLLSLTGCTASSSAIMDTARYSASRLMATEVSMQASSKISYLKISIDDGRVALLALGYIEGRGTDKVEVWYSAEGEVLKLRDGRIIATVGLSTDWRRVTFSRLPPWTNIGKLPQVFERERDVMPGYRLNIREMLEIHEIPPPARNPFADIEQGRVRWYEEKAIGPTSEPQQLPPARYAIRIDLETPESAEPVYGEQCLSLDLCFSWQKILPRPEKPS